MALTIKIKGKKRALESPPPSPTDSPSPVLSESEPPHPTKRVRRKVETRQCPVCEEQIPLRMLSMHALLESERVEEVIRKVGSPDITYEDMDNEPGPSSRSRRSAIKARKSLSTRSITMDSVEQSNKTIQAVKQHRKQRHAKLKELARESEENRKEPSFRQSTGAGNICPVCSATVGGDQDVFDAHVDSCLANESRLEESRERERQHRRAMEEEVWEDLGDEGGHGGYIGNVRGTGFHSRDLGQQDVDDDIDVDGDDQALFGDAQFTEGDILPIDEGHEDIGEDIEVDIVESDGEDDAQQEQKRLRDLVAGKLVLRTSHGRATEVEGSGIEEGDLDKIELDIISARHRGNKAGLILALEHKIKLLECNREPASPGLLCRICLEPYTDATASTGCWHTCCRLCWLRCLGSTKLCPICKRITAATDLRRVYL
ncbi:hypothetical protein B0H34DRAFT_245164 [Crassisporium funariophilum]|nr:hypothetical protein B0H34DRAFT_245164 [Crassisporium funariophilum]